MSEPATIVPVIEMRGAQVAALRDPTMVILADVDWTVMPGEFWVVAGPQHSGKSDLLLHAAGLMAPASGTCRVLGYNTNDFDDAQVMARQRIGLVFADGKLFNQYTVAQNVALPLSYHKGPPEAELAAAVKGLLDLLELTPYANLTPGSVPAAWRQRAALARALALEPDVLLLDNPNSGLMARQRAWLVDFLDQLWRGHEFFGRRPMTLVVTTDDLHAWEHSQRKFAVLHEGKFTKLGAWGAAEFLGHRAVQDLLVLPPAKSPAQ